MASEMVPKTGEIHPLVGPHPFHPLTEISGPLDPAKVKQFQDLIDSGETLEPIVIWQAMIIDGRHRYRAARLCGSSQIMAVDLIDEMPVEFMMQVNGQRIDQNTLPAIVARLHKITRYPGTIKDFAAAAGVSLRRVLAAQQLKGTE